MAQRPHIILPRPAPSHRVQRNPFVPPIIRYPGGARQGQRLSNKFQALQDAFEREAAALRTHAGGAPPEEVVVLETVGSVQNFIRVVQNTPGLEWMGEWEEEDIPPDEDFYVEGQAGGTTLSGQLYLVMSNQQAIQQVIGAWNQYRRHPAASFPFGLAPWRNLFAQLRDVRLWDTQDRLRNTGVMDYWRDLIESGNAPDRIRFEAELWHRENAFDRAFQAFARVVDEEGGAVIARATISDIAYDAVLMDLPRGSIEAIVAQPDTRLLRSREVMYFRPVGQSVFPLPDDRPLRAPADAAQAPPPPQGDPVVAVLDGFPLENHPLIAGRLIVDDPDGWSGACPADHRHHGTAMCSLISRGELDANEPPAARPVYVRPILRPDPQDWRTPPPETIPLDVLPVDIVHRAVRRMLAGEGAEPPAAPSVRVINLSVGDPDQMFDRAVSSWARLLDWLAWKYNVLFIVSAGNHPRDIELEIPRADLAKISPADLRIEVLKAIAADARFRRVLAPAEAINALTVGALHLDSSNLAYLGTRRDIIGAGGLPSPISAVGHGFRRAMKPEILLPGGRQLYTEKVGGNVKATLSAHLGAAEPGHKVACPGPPAGVDGPAVPYVRGTSNAAAIASRAAARLHDRLLDLRAEAGGDALTDSYLPVLLKTLLVHGSCWGECYDALKEVLRNPENSRRFRDYVGRFLGYGAADCDRILSSTDQRVTLIGVGELAADGADLFSVPLPPSLSGQRVWRRLTITLGWFSPVNPRHRSYRRAALWFDPPKDSLRVERSNGDWRAVQRGTVQHEVLEGESATAYVDGEALQIQVNCRADAGSLDGQVRYALAVSLEVADNVNIPVYDEVRVRLRPPVPVSANP